MWDMSDAEQDAVADAPGPAEARDAALVPSPPYPGERDRVRGGTSTGADCANRAGETRNSTPGPSPRPSPPSTGERGNGDTRAWRRKARRRVAARIAVSLAVIVLAGVVGFQAAV